MPESLTLRLWPLGGEGLDLRRSGIRWLRGDGEMCRAGEAIGFCHIGILGEGRARFADEQADLQVAFVTRFAGRLHHAPNSSRGGWLDQVQYNIRWLPGQRIGTLEVETGAGPAEADSALVLHCLAGRRVSELAEDRSGLLTGWHDRKRAWRFAGPGRGGSVLGLGICELSPVLRGQQGAFLEMLGGASGPAQVIDVSDAPLVPCARVLVEQIRRTPEDAAILAEDFKGIVSASPGAASAGDWIFAAVSAAALGRSPVFDRHDLLTEAGIETSLPADALILSINSEPVFRLQHRKLGYSFHCHSYRLRDLGPAASAWLRQSF